MSDEPIVVTEAPTAPVVEAVIADVAPVAVGDAAPVTAEVIEPITLLGADKDSTKSDKTVDAGAETLPDAVIEETKEEGAQSDEPAPLPSYEEWSLPEGVTIDMERGGDFNTLLGEFQNLTKADQTVTQEFGQKLVDYHIAEVQSAIQKSQEYAMQYWEKQKNDWKESFMKDPEYGGNRWQTTVGAANDFIKMYGGSAEQQSEVRQALEQSGLGNHPGMIRLLAKANMSIQEGTPLAAQKPITEAVSKVSKRYGGM